MRSGETGEISTADLLVGDVMLLSTGDILAADGLLFEGNDIRRAQASASLRKLYIPPWVRASAAEHCSLVSSDEALTQERPMTADMSWRQAPVHSCNR